MNPLQTALHLQTYCIAYELKTTGKDYEGLINAITSLGTWWHQSLSVWLVSTQESSDDILKALSPYLDCGDKLIVIQVINNFCSVGMSRQEIDWCNHNILPLIE